MKIQCLCSVTDEYFYPIQNPPMYSLQGTLNSSIPVPSNLAGQNSMNLCQSTGDITNTSSSYLGTSSSNSNGKNRCNVPGTSPSNLDMLSMSMEMFEPGKSTSLQALLTIRPNKLNLLLLVIGGFRIGAVTLFFSGFFYYKSSFF